jgi:hypothetical protein
VKSPERDVTIDLREIPQDRGILARTGAAGAPYHAIFAKAGEDGFAESEAVERFVFARDYGLSNAEMDVELSAYDDRSFFIAVVETATDRVVGAMRIVVPSDAPAKSLYDIESRWGAEPTELLQNNGIRFDPLATWDLATLSVLPECRSGDVSLALYQAACTASRRCGIGWFVAIIDCAVMRMLRFRLRRVFSAFPGLEPMDYEGSPCIPAWADLVAFRDRLVTKDLRLLETLFYGQNLEHIVIPSHWDDIAQRFTRIALSA